MYHFILTYSQGGFVYKTFLNSQTRDCISLLPLSESSVSNVWFNRWWGHGYHGGMANLELHKFETNKDKARWVFSCHPFVFFRTYVNRRMDGQSDPYVSNFLRNDNTNYELFPILSYNSGQICVSITSTFPINTMSILMRIGLMK